MAKLSKENSEKAAKPVRKMMEIAWELDITYLSLALEDMRKNHNFKDAAAILNPNIFSHFEMQELEAAKLEQLELMIKLAQNARRILELELKHKQAKDHAKEMGLMFDT